MTWTIWVSAVIFAGVGLLVALRGTGRQPTVLADAYARKVDLPLDASRTEVLARYLGLRSRIGGLGAAAGSLIAGLVLTRIARADWLIVSFVMIGYWLGFALASAVLAIRHTRRRPLPDGPKLARTRHLSPADYLAPVERYGSSALALTSLVLVVLLLALGPRLGLDVPPVVALVLVVTVPVLMTAVQELVARRVVGLPQTTATPIDLAWDDAVRAVALRDVVTLSLGVSFTAPFVLLNILSASESGGWPANPAVGVIDAVFAILMALGALTAVVSIAQAPQRHFRRRLWADEVA